jgi:single stranded DNA-binding protein
MMAGFHQIVVVGNLGKDAVQHSTKQGKVFWTFSVAVTEKWGAADNRRESTTWYEAALWEDQGAGVVEFLKKGKQVMVVGKPGSRAWKASDGTAMSTNTITVRTVQLLGNSGGSRREEGDWFAQQDAMNYGDPEPERSSRDIPF